MQKKNDCFVKHQHGMAEPFTQPGTNFFVQTCTIKLEDRVAGEAAADPGARIGERDAF